MALMQRRQPVQMPVLDMRAVRRWDRKGPARRLLAHLLDPEKARRDKNQWEWYRWQKHQIEQEMARKPRPSLMSQWLP